MPWGKKYDRTEVLERAMQAFWARGYEATSMADLVDATGINRGSIYAAFDNKRGLYLQALKHYDRNYRSEFLSRLARDHAPRAAILEAFRAAAAGGRGGHSGCLLVNSALELSPHDAEIAEFIRSSLDEVRSFFATMVSSGQAHGTIPADRPARQTAGALLSLFLGLRVLHRADTARDAYNEILLQAELMLD